MSTTESVYLLIVNRQICKANLSKDPLDENDRIDVLISLHLVLEIGVNTFFRRAISSSFLGMEIKSDSLTDNLDSISFRDKITMLVHLANLDPHQSEEVKLHYKIIGKLKDFCFFRNRLLHGHSISTYYSMSTSKNSKLRSEMSKEELIDKHVKHFKEIVEGVKFFSKHCNLRISDTLYKSYVNEYLDTSFLDVNSPSKN